MEKDIIIYSNPQFGQIRTMTDGKGEPLFCAKDVAEALGYSNSRDAIARHVDAEDKTTVVIHDGGSNYKTQAVFINESGLYSLILTSKLEGAKQFKHWVTSEVLPAIRKHGVYSMYGRQISMYDLECVKRAFVVLNIQNKDLREENECLKQQLEEASDKVQYCDRCLQSKECLTMTQVAQSVQMTVHELTHKLLSLGVIYRQSGQYMLYAKYNRRQYASTRTEPIKYKNGNMGTNTYLVWTQKGARFIQEMFNCKQLSLFDEN